MSESRPVKDLREFKEQLDSLSETLNYFKPDERDKAIKILQECIEGCKNSISLEVECHQMNIEEKTDDSVMRSENPIAEKTHVSNNFNKRYDSKVECHQMNIEEKTDDSVMRSENPIAEKTHVSNNFNKRFDSKDKFKEPANQIDSSYMKESEFLSAVNNFVAQNSVEVTTDYGGSEYNLPSEESDFQSEEDWKTSLKCPKCKEEYENKTELLEHLQSHSGKPKSCVDCQKVYYSSLAFRCHKQMAMCVKTGKVFKCGLCNRMLFGESQYNTHVNAHKRNQCQTCGDHFSRQKHLEAHIVNVHKGSITRDMFRCHICERQFAQRRSLVYHYKIAHPGSNILCEVCLEMFSCMEDLERHLATHKLTIFTCEKCGQTFSRRQQYLLHLKEHERYKCETCSEGFSAKKVAEAHAAKGHTVRGLEPQLQCAQCGELFLTRALLTAHMDEHTGGKKLSCEKCKMTFKRMTNYRNHLETSEHLRGEAPKHLLACDECGKTFTNKNNLRVHISRVHKAKQEYRCSYCEYKTRVLNNLKRHVALHTEKPQFICDKCGGQFQTKASLQEHVSRFHSESKDFSCDKCGNTFSRSSDLNRHLMNIHSDVPLYSCHCGNGYKSLSSLRRHQLLGHGKVEDKQKRLKKLFPSETKSSLKKKSKKVKEKPESTATNNSSDADDLQLLNSEMPDVSSVITEPSTIVVMADRHPQEMLQVSYSMDFPGEDKSQVVYTQSLDMGGLQVVDSMIQLENDHPKQESNVLINVRNLFGRNDYILQSPIESAIVNNLDDPMAADIPNISMSSQKQNVISGLQEYIIPNELNFLNV